MLWEKLQSAREDNRGKIINVTFWYGANSTRDCHEKINKKNFLVQHRYLTQVHQGLRILSSSLDGGYVSWVANRIIKKCYASGDLLRKRDFASQRLFQFYTDLFWEQNKICVNLWNLWDILWVYRIWLPIHPLLYDSLLNVEIDFLEPGTGVEAGTFLVDTRQVAMT